MDIAALFLHNAAHERDRVEYRGDWLDDEKEPIEAALDVTVDDPAHWRNGRPRVNRKVDGGYNHFIAVKWSNGDYGFKRFTWSNFKYFTSLGEIVMLIDHMHRPIAERAAERTK